MVTNSTLGDMPIDQSFSRANSTAQLSDMGVRLSFWHSLLRCGWMLHTQRPLSAAEQEEEDKLRHAILEARKQATEEEFNTPIRTFRLLIGVKGS